MAGKRGNRAGMALTAYQAIMGSVPTVTQPEPHGPLTPDEIHQAAELMDRLAAEETAERAGDFAVPSKDG